MTHSGIHPAVVLGLGAGGLAAVRSLGKKGIKVYGLYSDKKEEPGRLSRFCESIKVPDINSDEKEFLEKLLSLGKSLKKKAVLISASDKHITFVCKYRHELSKYFLFNIPEGDFIERLVSKIYMRDLALNNGLLIPSTFCPENHESIEKIALSINYPCIVKPVNSYSINFPGKNLIFQNSHDLIKEYSANPHFIKRTIIQEIIPGGDDSLFQLQGYLNEDSEPLAIMTFRKYRQYLPNFGIGCYVRTEEIKNVQKLALTFLKNIKYKGFIGIEFKKHKDTGQYYFIELNPRIPWCLALASDSGINITYIAYTELTGGILNKKLLKQNNGVTWIDFKRDLISFIHKYSRSEITFRNWFHSLFSASSFAYWDFKDPAPFVQNTFSLMKSIAKVAWRYIRTGSLLSRQYQHSTN